MKRLSSSLAFCLIVVCTALAQQPSPPSKQADQKPSPTPREFTDVDVVRITTNLVQIDAVITDESGKHVTDLRPDEIEILEDGKPQKIINFSYVQIEPSTTTVVQRKEKNDNLLPEPPRKLQPQDVHRTMALVVDDLGLSFNSVYDVRRALKKFVDELMQPNDLVAIVTTGGGVGALQQFTTDKRQLYAAIERVKWNPIGRTGIGAIAPTRNDGTPPPELVENQTASEDDLDQFREDLFTVGTLGALNYIIRGLRPFPGRKSVVLFTDGLVLFSPSSPDNERVRAALRVVLDLANRSSVVINTMDARGLQILGLSAADSTSHLTSQQLRATSSQRRAAFVDSQQDLTYLAEETGGLSFKNTNDLAGGIRKILEHQSGYYLIGYRPDDSTFDRENGRGRFHRVSLKVKRPGKYNVRTRTGFLGVTDERLASLKETPQQQLISALLSPFSSAGVHLRLTCLFANDAKIGSLMRSFLHVKASDLTFTKETDGTHTAVFDVIAVTFGDNGTVIGQFNFRQTLQVKESGFERILKNGFAYNVMLPVKKPGAYQLRTALRDLGSGKVGSASQFIEVPDIKKDRLITSGLLLKAMPAEQYAKNLPTAEQAAYDRVDDTDPIASTAVRKFQLGTAMIYGLFVYNAKIDSKTSKPQLVFRVRLFRNGELIFTGDDEPIDVGDQKDMRRLGASGALQLGSNMAPGEYILQIVVKDLLRNDKKRIATQWMDFEIVE